MDSSIPSWLDPIPITSPSPQHSTYPATPLAKYPRTSEELTLMELTFDNFFEGSIDRIALGHPLRDIIADDPRDISIVEYLRWVRKDKTRKERLKEAEEIAAEVLIMQTIGIAEGADSMEDTNRSTLRVNNNWKIAAAYSPKRFGKEASMATGNSGGGGIVINIGQVESPYVVDTGGGDTDRLGSSVVTDVEVK